MSDSFWKELGIEPPPTDTGAPPAKELSFQSHGLQTEADPAGWPRFVSVASSSEEGLVYQVEAHADQHCWCPCRGYGYRGTCKHVEIAKNQLFGLPIPVRPERPKTAKSPKAAKGPKSPKVGKRAVDKLSPEDDGGLDLFFLSETEPEG